MTQQRASDNTDLELLEAHLDGELTPADAASLSRRLGDEPRLALDLERLRDERSVRRAAWASFEPDAGHAQAQAAAALAAAERGDRGRRAAALAGRATAAAAVVLVAFACGWMARGRAAPQHPTIVVPASDGAHRGDHPFVTSGSGDNTPFPPTRPPDGQGVPRGDRPR